MPSSERGTGDCCHGTVSGIGARPFLAAALNILKSQSLAPLMGALVDVLDSEQPRGRTVVDEGPSNV
jgi:hypothetical protein